MQCISLKFKGKTVQKSSSLNSIVLQTHWCQQTFRFTQQWLFVKAITHQMVMVSHAWRKLINDQTTENSNWKWTVCQDEDGVLPDKYTESETKSYCSFGLDTVHLGKQSPFTRKRFRVISSANFMTTKDKDDKFNLVTVISMLILIFVYWIPCMLILSFHS